jgi:hypothetical protein
MRRLPGRSSAWAVNFFDLKPQHNRRLRIVVCSFII